LPARTALLLAGLLVFWVTVPTKVIGIRGGFGAGAMIAAVSFDLLPEAQTDGDAHELTDSLLVRAWGITRRRSHRPGVLPVGHEQLTECPVLPRDL
jgi:hypothetical protein